MPSQMNSEGVRLGKPLQTNTTHEWFLSSVHPQMYSEIARLTEGLGALGALEWFFAIMDPHVDLEGGGTQEHFLADFTRQLLLIFVFGSVGL